MDLAKARSLKKEILANLYKNESGHVINTLNISRFQTSLDEAMRRPEKRISVGYSTDKSGNFKIEVLVDRENRQAHNAAEEIKSALGVENVNIEVIATSFIPPKNGLDEVGFHHILGNRVKNQKLTLGMSVSHKELSAGSLGAFVRDQEGKDCILSCNHVLADNGSVIDKRDPTSKRIFHPGNTPDNPVTGAGHIADLEEWVELRKQQSNSSDSAYASIIDDTEFLGNIIPAGIGAEYEGERIFEAPLDFVPEKGAIVYKIGCRTGFTAGIVEQVSVDNAVIKKGGKNYMFDNLIKINWRDKDNPFSLPGDSGSLAFVRQKGKLFAIGMVFAGMPDDTDLITDIYDNGLVAYSYACILRDILKHNKLTFTED